MNGAAELFEQTTHQAAAGLPGLVFDAHSRVMSLNPAVALSYRLDEAELARRATRGLGPITSPDVLRLLVALPHDETVPVAALEAEERVVLRQVPAGAVEMEADRVRRLAIPPLQAGLVLVSARSWRQGLEQASRFAPFCSRAMVLRRPPRDLEVARMEADFYGVGVVIADGSGLRVLVPPLPFSRRRFTAAGWLFLEEAFAQTGNVSGAKI